MRRKNGCRFNGRREVSGSSENNRPRSVSAPFSKPRNRNARPSARGVQLIDLPRHYASFRRPTSARRRRGRCARVDRERRAVESSLGARDEDGRVSNRGIGHFSGSGGIAVKCCVDVVHGSVRQVSIEFGALMAQPSTKVWKDVSITAYGQVVVQGMLLLPVDRENLARVVVKDKKGLMRLLPAGKRGDAGDAAVLPGNLLAVLGGLNATISYRPATWRDVIRYKPIVKIQLLVATLTLIATVLASISSFVGTRSPTTPSFSADAGPWVLGIAFVLAVSNIYATVTADLA